MSCMNTSEAFMEGWGSSWMKHKLDTPRKIATFDLMTGKANLGPGGIATVGFLQATSLKASPS